MIHQKAGRDSRGGKVDLVFRDEVFSIIGAAMEVHNELGPGFLEAVYQEALEVEFGIRSIPYKSQADIKIHYKGRQLAKDYVADFMCYEEIVVELKALENLTSREEAQLLNYLKATGFKVGVLINFGSVGPLQWKRYVR